MEQETKNIPLSKPFRQALPPELVGRVHERFLTLYYSSNLPTNPKLLWHLRDNILPGLALYQLWREDGDTSAEALEKIDKIFEKWAVRSQNRMKFFGRLPFIYPLLRRVVKSAMKQYPADGWLLEWLENSPDAIRFNMKSCYYYDTLTRFGAPELTASFCRMDDLVYGEMSPYLVWQRTQTIGRGATYCDFCFARAKNN